MIESQHDVHLALPVEVDEDAAADGAVEAGPKALQHSHGLLPLESRPQTLNATGGDLIDSADSASDAVAEYEVEISPSHVDWLCLMKKFTVAMGVSVDKLADDLDPDPSVQQVRKDMLLEQLVFTHRQEAAVQQRHCPLDLY